MREVIITKGLPASGKTTWAKTQQTLFPGKYKNINKDDLRAMLDNGQHNKKNEKFIEAMRDQLILQSLMAGYDVIVSDTNLSPRHEEHIRQVFGAPEVKVWVKDFTDVPLETCIERDLKRPNSVGSKVITGMYNQFLAPSKNEVAWEYDPSLPTAVICDLDGTLALHDGRSAYDEEKCDTDKVNTRLLHVLQGWFARGGKVIYVSGRHDKVREKTERWLRSNAAELGPLYMRRTGDDRNDSIVKKELYEEHIKGKYNVVLVFDDRPRVIRMWKAEGLLVADVGLGYEF